MTLFRGQRRPELLPSEQEKPSHPPEPQVLDIAATLTAQQAQAAAFQMDGMPLQEISRQMRVPLSDLRRWNVDPDYQFALQYARAEVMQSAVDGLRTGVGEAVAYLRDVIADGSQTSTARTRAATTVINAAKGLPQATQQEDEPQEAAHVKQSRDLSEACGDDDAAALLEAAAELIYARRTRS